MSQQDRREFMKQLAKGALYAAPVVGSIALPKRAMASHKPTHCPPGQGCDPGTGNLVAPQQAPTSTNQPAPWQAPPPGSDPTPRR